MDELTFEEMKNKIENNIATAKSMTGKERENFELALLCESHMHLYSVYTNLYREKLMNNGFLYIFNIATIFLLNTCEANAVTALGGLLIVIALVMNVTSSISNYKCYIKYKEEVITYNTVLKHILKEYPNWDECIVTDFYNASFFG